MITNLSALVGIQINKHDGKKFICDRCLNPFTSEQVLNKHYEICDASNPVREFYPQNEIKKFTKVEYQLECPFFIVADFETLQEPIETVFPNPEKSSTTPFANHKPCSAAYYIVSVDDNFQQKPKMFKGERCVRMFLDSLKDDVKKIKTIIDKPLAMNLSEDEKLIMKNAKKCHICDTDFKNRIKLLLTIVI